MASVYVEGRSRPNILITGTPGEPMGTVNEADIGDVFKPATTLVDV